MMKNLLTVLSLCSAGLLFSQSAADYCDGSRYKDLVFLNTDMTADVQYGQADQLSGTTKNLTMDIYQPQGDAALKRPLIVLAHGGSFIGGDKSNMASTCEYFSRMGYVTATISYRLIDELITDSTQYIEAALMAINDMRAAVRYFKEDAANSDTYKVDTNFVFAGGISAGAIMAAHLNFLDENDDIPAFLQTIVDNHGGFEGNSSTNTQHSSKVHGAILYSGALIRDHWVDASNGPVHIVHEEFDDVVPYQYGASSAAFFPIYLYGGGAIKDACNANGVYEIEDFYAGSTEHVGYLPDDAIPLGNTSGAVLQGIICNTLTTNNGELSNNTLSLYPNPTSNTLTITNYDPNRMDFQLISLDGKILATAISQSGVVDVSDLSPGVYQVTIEENGKYQQLRFVKE